MSILNPTSPDRMVDSSGRPYFLWDLDMTLGEFRERLRSSELQVRGYLVGKLMRQAKPDDVFLFVSPREIAALWPVLRPFLGTTAEFWAWLLGEWQEMGIVQG
jgi:hypothetical protein